MITLIKRKGGGAEELKSGKAKELNYLVCIWMSQKFEDLLVRQKAQDLTIVVYQFFQRSKDYGFRDQILRASVSIMNNIAEGYDRETEKDKAKFFVIAKGSCAELRSMVHLAKQIGYLDEDQHKNCVELCYNLSGMLASFINKFNR